VVGLKRKTEKARCRRPLSMLVIKWPAISEEDKGETFFLGAGTDGVVVLVDYDANFLHQADLLFIVTCEVDVLTCLVTHLVATVEAV
jgi:hypothetical protein